MAEQSNNQAVAGDTEGNGRPNWIQRYTITGLIIIAAIALGFFNLTGSVVLDVDLTWEDYSSLLTNLAFIAILAERFNEAFVGASRYRAKQRKLLAVKRAKTQDDKATAQAALEEFRADTAAIVMKIAFAVGLVAALGGVRALQILFDATDLAGPQQFIFDLIDVLLTAGLIAGGSKGVNKVSALLAAHMETQRQNARERRPSDSGG